MAIGAQRSTVLRMLLVEVAPLVGAALGLCARSHSGGRGGRGVYPHTPGAGALDPVQALWGGDRYPRT
jgi:hypothetical protein